MRGQRKRRLRTGGAPGGAASARHHLSDGGVDTSSGAEDELVVRVDRSRRRPVVTVVGSLHGSGAALLAAMLDHVRQTEGRTAVVDLSHVGDVDSHGLAPVLEANATVRGASPPVTRLLELLAGSLPLPAWDERLRGVPALSGPRPH